MDRKRHRWLFGALLASTSSCAGILGINQLGPVDAGGGDAPSDERGSSDGGGPFDADVSSNADGSFDADASVDATDSADAAHTGPLPPDAACNPTSPFGTPVLVSELYSVNSAGYDARLTVDELTVYFASSRSTGWIGYLRLFVATRATFSEPFGKPELLPGINPGSKENQFAPSITSDGLSLYLNQGGGTDAVYVSTRAKASDNFGVPVAVAGLANATETELTRANPIVTPDGTALYYYQTVSEPHTDEIFVSYRLEDGGFGQPNILDELSAGGNSSNVAVNADQTIIVFSSTRGSPDGGDDDIWISTRASADQGTLGWGSPVNLTEVNSSANDEPTWISADGCRLYLQSSRSNANLPQLYLATRPQ